MCVKSFLVPIESYRPSCNAVTSQGDSFCKLNSDTPDSVLRDILKRKWGLKPPTLIITVFGTDFEKKRKLKMIFKKGLWKAAESEDQNSA
uniref:Transient receptor potential cation channel subfamily M member 2 n=1 Tax=Schistosoma haematobium TaxID=6185 RepID=A0A094ZYH7_SCHHA